MMKKILLIEDDGDIAELERDYLETSGFAVDICADGDEGKRRARTGEYHLILLDVMLPGADGFAICRAVRKELDIPILMVSARLSDVDKIRALGRYQMTAGVNYENRDLTAALNLSYWGDRGYNGTSGERVTFTPITTNLLVSNLHLAYRFTHDLTGTFDVDNLFNRRDYTNSGRYYTIGRSFLVGVNYAF